MAEQSQKENDDRIPVRAFAPAIIVFCFGLITTIVVGLFDSWGATVDVIVVSLVFTGGVASLSYAIDRSRRSTVRKVTEENEALEKNLREVILYGPRSREAQDRRPHLVYVREQVLGHFKELLMSLEMPTYSSAGDCLRSLLSHASNPELLDIRAVCGDKNYQDDRVGEYYGANYRVALKDGGSVRRIFLERPGVKWKTGETRAYEAHVAAPNVQVRVIDEREYAKLNHYRLPDGFGFAIFDTKTVIVHWGLTGSSERDEGYLFDDAALVGIYVDLFDDLWEVYAGDREADPAVAGTPR